MPLDLVGALLDLSAAAAAITAARLKLTDIPPPPPPPPPPPVSDLPPLPEQSATIKTAHDEVPNFGRAPTKWPVRSGAWSDAAVWNGGTLPAAGDVVAVGPQAVVTYDAASDERLAAVSVLAGGTLRFRPDVPTRLRVTHLLVLDGGTLEVGTPAAPVTASAEIIVNDAPIDAAADPHQWGHGLLVWGRVVVHGAPLSATFVRLAAEPKAGDTTLRLEKPVSGWAAGDALVLPDSRQLYAGVLPYESPTKYVWNGELPAVEAVSADGLTVTLVAPLAFAHPAGRDPDGAVRFLPHVGNLSRTVTVKSERAAGVRGHTAFFGRADVDVRYAKFASLGRSRVDPFGPANQKGRYAVHFHHLDGPADRPDGYRFRFRGNAVLCRMDPQPVRWGVAVHGSSFGHVADNVLYNWAGAGLVTSEDGGETATVFERNFVVRTRGKGGREDDRGNADAGHVGNGVWGRSADVVVRDTVVADSRRGFTLWAEGQSVVRRPLAAGGTVAVDPRNVPLREFARNEVYGGLTEVGLDLWGLGTASYTPFPDSQESVVKDFAAWHVSQKAYYNYKTGRVTFDGFVGRGDAAQLASGRNQAAAFFGGDYATFDFTLKNFDVRGFRCGYAAGSMGDVRLEDGFLHNFQNVVVTPLYWQGSADGIPPRTLTLRALRDGGRVAAPPNYTGPSAHVAFLGGWRGTPSATVVTRDEVYSYAHGGAAGADYRLYYAEQAADFVLPQSVRTASGAYRLWACPEPDMTNAAAWAEYGIAFAGAVAPAGAAPLDGVSGGLAVPLR